jgi:hypothetical protein
MGTMMMKLQTMPPRDGRAGVAPYRRSRRTLPAAQLQQDATRRIAPALALAERQQQDASGERLVLMMRKT